MNKPKSAAKLPQGRVMPEAYYAFLVGEEMFYRAAPYKNAKGTHHIIIRMPTLAAAKTGLANIRKHGLAALLKKPSRWGRMTKEEKRRAIVQTMKDDDNAQRIKHGGHAVIGWPLGSFETEAKAILSLIQP